MTVKISDMTPVSVPGMGDLKEVDQAGATFSESNQQLFTLFGLGRVGPLTSSTELTAPIPHVIILEPSGTDQVLTFPAFTTANGARVGDLIYITNKGEFFVALNYSDDSIIPGSVVNAGNSRIYSIKTLGTPGVLEVVDVFGTIKNQNIPLPSTAGGTGSDTGDAVLHSLVLNNDSSASPLDILDLRDINSDGHEQSIVYKFLNESAGLSTFSRLTTLAPNKIAGSETSNFALELYNMGTPYDALAIDDIGAVFNNSLNFRGVMDGSYGGVIKAIPYSPKVITQSTTSKTLQIADSGALINCTATSGTTTITIAAHATVAIDPGTKFIIQNSTTNQLVTINSSAVTLIGYTPVIGNGGTFELMYIDSDIWKCVYLFEAATVTSTFTWGSTTSGAQNIIIRRTNDTVILNMNFFLLNATSETSTMQSNTGIPARFRPAYSLTYQSDVIISGGAKVGSRYVLDLNGIIYFQSSTGGNFATGSSIQTETISYPYVVA